ncbi:hypothetical protein Agabi119p4_7654 [Agaricus bisporus var. burnettii]|uniref:Peptidase A1 domain-containing protein n=1 Tax=Agaricus bisporus var. burnettii TaxID=192524 RepID=A0A8H7EZ89_AGABI|nr:hypothetical protein Agabi119p4_7654 [Agaricus bisporus var. burnettii]
MPSLKGKAKAVVRDDPGGSTAGVVLPLNIAGSGIYDVAYTLPVNIGTDGTTYSLQVDTGSSDLWVVSSSCSSSLCGQTKGHSYDPSHSRPTGVDFAISYLSGEVSGPIVWDQVAVGGYSIDNQAFSAATSVASEPLSPDFQGILGLALPANSIIAELIPPQISDAPDGAAWASNLFSITPVDDAPSSRFLSLTLERPGSTQIPSLLGIGQHPPQIVDDPSRIQYSTVVSDPTATLFWKASVRGITVYVDGEPRRVDIGHSNTGGAFPIAVIDSGVPFILTSSKVANAIYGAIDVHPAQDGSYYVPCRTPLNMTINIDDRPEIPLHPLDLTAEPPQDNRAEFCIGLIQAADSQLAHSNSNIGDMILGVPFMRNVYTVMAYAPPDSKGLFSPVDAVNDKRQPIDPRLGLLSLTDPKTALSEFNTVRILNQPLGPNDPSNTSNSKVSDQGEKRLSVGIIVLISLLGFFAICSLLFLIRWLIFRRRYKKERDLDRQEDLVGDKRALAYQLAGRNSSDLGGMPNEDTLRAMRYEAYKKQEHAISSSRVHSMVGQWVDEFGTKGEYNDETLVGKPLPAGATARSSRSSQISRHSKSNSLPELQLPHHQRTPSELPTEHQRTTSIARPLLGEEDPTSTHSNHDHPYRDGAF